MTKKFLTIIIFFAFMAKGSAQIEVHSSNQVGIGTTNPQYKLHVVGDAFITGNYLLGTASTFLGTSGNNPVTFKSNNVLSGSTGSSAKTNVSFGYEALLNPQSSIENTAVGYRALRNTYNSNNQYGQNTAIGSYTLYSNTTGRENTANGSNALYSNTTGIQNTAIGSGALYSNTTGYSNNALGTYPLYSNISGYENQAFGNNALLYNTTGIRNDAFGTGALMYNTTGSYNTAIGYLSLYVITGGDCNVAVGQRALGGITTGSNNTAVGNNAGYSSSFTNSTSIGNNSLATSSNQVKIGNSSVTSIGGYVAWTNFSDGRAKKNIRTDVPGLSFINSLQPVTYNIDLDVIDELLKIDNPESYYGDSIMVDPKIQEWVEMERKAREAKEKIVQTGFVAQDVETAAKSVGYDFSGVDVDESGIYSLRYGEFVVPLVKAVQELSEQNDLLREQINELNKRIEALERKENEF